MHRQSSGSSWNLVPLILCALLVACPQPQSFSSQHFSFPESSKPHEGNWQYLGVVLMPDVKGDARTAPRQILVRVVDQAKAELLRDEFQVEGVSRPRAVVTWPEQGQFTVSIQDAGQPAADGSLRRVRDVTYVYDVKLRTYQRAR